MLRNAILKDDAVYLSGEAAEPDFSDPEIKMILKSISGKIGSLQSSRIDRSYRDYIKLIEQHIAASRLTVGSSFSSDLAKNLPHSVYVSNLLHRDFERLIEEQQICQKLIVDDNLTFENADLSEILLTINKRIARSSSHIRRTNISIQPQNGGKRIVFPDHQSIDDAIKSVDIKCRKLLSISRMAASVYIFLAILHIHPFMDGNGGTARIAMNIAINGDRDASYFMPIQLIESIDRVSFNIHERRASYFGLYNDFLKYINSYMDIELLSRGK